MAMSGRCGGDDVVVVVDESKATPSELNKLLDIDQSSKIEGNIGSGMLNVLREQTSPHKFKSQSATDLTL